jgi:hypothetical protein
MERGAALMAPDLGKFRYTRVGAMDDIPPFDPKIVDVVILDMNFGVPNLGHDSLVLAVHESSAGLRRELGHEVRVLSFDVRRSGLLPPWDPERFSVFIGTGGPGHLDPRRNDGIEAWCEGVCESAEWEAPLWTMFDRIREDERTALVAFCHSFGVVCRWLGAAEPVMRSAEKGKSYGIVGYRLTREALGHPWFSRFAAELVDPPNFRVLDSRQFDLVPVDPFPEGVVQLAREEDERGGDAPALTMIEVARDRDGVMPRILAANHHPEVVDLEHLQAVLDEKLEKGEIDATWHRERGESLRRFWSEPDTDVRMQRTARYTLLEPLTYHLRRAIEARRSASVTV